MWIDQHLGAVSCPYPVFSKYQTNEPAVTLYLLDLKMTGWQKLLSAETIVEEARVWSVRTSSNARDKSSTEVSHISHLLVPNDVVVGPTMHKHNSGAVFLSLCECPQADSGATEGGVAGWSGRSLI